MMNRWWWIVLLVFAGEAVQAQGHALLFDGLDDKVTIPDRYADFDLGTELTIEAWVKPDSTGEWLPVIQGEHNQGIAWTIALDFDFWFCGISVPGTDSVYSGAGAITPGEWHHLACTYDGTTMRIYQDGLPIGSRVHNEGGSVSDVDRSVLAAWDSQGLYLPGMIDEVLLWSEVRSPDEIDLDYLSCVNGTEPGLVGFWRLDEATGQLVTDSSQNENHGWRGSDASAETSDPVWVVSDAPLLCIFFDSFESGDTSAWACFGCPIADFTFSVNGPTVQFLNQSTGIPPLSYYWDFGDGTNSTETDPQHTYASPDTYQVTLTVMNARGVDWITKPVTVSQ